jgi:MATE family multidrug resistance protein
MNLSYKEHFRNTALLAYPVVIGQLGHMMMGVVDSLMIGRVGAVPLAASAIANGLFFLVFVIGLGVTFAISPLVAIASSSNKPEECSSLVKQGLLVNAALGIILLVVLLICADIIFYLNQPENVAIAAASYLRIIAYSILPLMIFQTFKQFIEGLTVMMPAMIITILANLFNAFGNWLFIFGNWGFPALGLDGAGISTLINRVFMATAMIWFVLNNRRYKEFKLLSLEIVNFPMIKKILKLGLPSGFQYFFEVGAFSFGSVMVGWIGTIQLAAHQIAMNLASITYMSITGISAAAAIRVGNGVGLGNIIETRRAGFSALILGAGSMLVFGCVFIILKNFLPTLYINNPEVISIASTLLIFAAIFQVFDGSQAVGLGILRGVIDVKIPTIITFTAYWIIMIPSGYLFAFVLDMGVNGIWLGYVIGLAASAILLNIRFNLRSKKKIRL